MICSDFSFAGLGGPFGPTLASTIVGLSVEITSLRTDFALPGLSILNPTPWRDFELYKINVRKFHAVREVSEKADVLPSNLI